MNKQDCTLVRSELTHAIKNSECFRGLGFNIEIGNMTYSADKIRFTCEVRDKSAPPKKMQALLDWVNANGGENLCKLDINAVAKSNDLTVNGSRLVGYKPRARKSPFIIRSSGGKDYVISERYALKLFAKS